MIRKVFYILAIPVIIILLVTSCYREDGEMMHSPSEQSDRITSLPESIGAGDTMYVSGVNLNEMTRIIFGPVVIIPNDVIFTADGIKFAVPTLVPNGENDFIIFFPGNVKASRTIIVSANPIVDWFEPTYGDVGDTVTVYGSNLFVVTGVTIGEVECEILSQPGEKLTFAVPSGATTDYIYLESVTITIPTEREFVACESSDDYVCLPTLNINGDFESATLGIIPASGEDGGSFGGNWYAPGVGGERQNCEIISSADVPEPWPGLGDLTLKVTLNSDYLNGTLTDNWQMQIVNDGFPVDTGRYFQFMGKIHSDVTGRQIKLTGGVSLPGYEDMEGDTTIRLQQGWNEWSYTIWHIGNQDQTQIRLQMNYGFVDNDGVTFYFDDIRVVDIGPREE